MKVCAAAGAVESVRRVKGLGPTAHLPARARGTQRRASAQFARGPLTCDRRGWWCGTVWATGMGRAFGSTTLFAPQSEWTLTLTLDSGRASYSHERHRPSKILVYEGSRLLTESI